MVSEEQILARLPEIPLMGNLNALDVWPVTNACMLSWILIMALPRWKHTPTLSLVAPLILALVYTLTFGSLLFLIPKDPNQGPPDMMSLQGIMTAFEDPTTVFGAWIHYCVYDPLIGRWMVLDSIELGASMTFHILVMIPLLIAALFLGPIGWLGYMAIARPLLMASSGSKEKKKMV